MWTLKHLSDGNIPKVSISKSIACSNSMESDLYVIVNLKLNVSANWLTEYLSKGGSHNFLTVNFKFLTININQTLMEPNSVGFDSFLF